MSGHGKSNFLMSHRGDSLREDAFADQANRPISLSHMYSAAKIDLRYEQQFPVDAFIALIKCGIPSKGLAKGLPLPSSSRGANRQMDPTP